MSPISEQGMQTKLVYFVAHLFDQESIFQGQSTAVLLNRMIVE